MPSFYYVIMSIELYVCIQIPHTDIITDFDHICDSTDCSSSRYVKEAMTTYGKQ